MIIIQETATKSGNNTYNDFNGTLGNLGRDLQGLEEGSLLRTKTSVHGFNVHRARGQGTGSCRSTDSVLHKPLTDLYQILLGKDEPNISLDVGEKPMDKQLDFCAFSQVLLTYFSRDGLFSRCPRIALRIMVFLPISTTA